MLGLKDADLKGLPHADPDKPSSVGVDHAELGWKVRRPDDLCLSFYVAWDREADEGQSPLNAMICLWLKERDRADSLASCLNALAEVPPFPEQPWEYQFGGSNMFFWLALAESEFTRFGERLDELVDFMIPFLRAAKGIKHYCSPS